MKIVATIEARMGSSRFPGKTVMEMVGKPMLELMIERVKRSKYINDIVIATSIDPSNEIIENLAKSVNIHCFRGSEDDVLDRVLNAAKSVNGDIIVELTGDCPLVDPVVIDMVIEKYLNGNYDYVCNVHAPERTPFLYSNFPLGLDSQVFSVDILEEVSTLTNDRNDREHVSLYIYSHPERFKIHCIKAPDEYSYPELNLMVDYEDDYNRIKRIYENLYLKNPEFSSLDVFEFLKNNKQL